MRLIDADNVNFHCNYDGYCTGAINSCKECENYVCDFRDIQEQPMAYDIDKVVEELEMHSFEFGTDTLPAHYVRLNEAIKIINQVGVSDDVCEAKQGKWIFDNFTAQYGNPYRCSCCNEEFGDIYNYCPNCGVAMKEVE